MKPANVLVRRISPVEIRVADFGCASPISRCFAPAGSRRYQAPELVIYSEGPCEKSDVWAAAVVIHTVALGRHPPSCEEQFQGAVLDTELSQVGGQEFVSWMQFSMQFHRDLRAKASEALSHSWLR